MDGNRTHPGCTVMARGPCDQSHIFFVDLSHRTRSLAVNWRSPMRTLGFLFTDLRGYTRFIDEHGDAAAANLVRDYRAIVREAIARHDGKEISTEGDSFFLVFESVSSSVRCAVDILGAAGTHDPPIRLGAGVHAGEAADGDVGYVAAPINVAAR